MTMYRLREINTNTIARPPAEFTPDNFPLEDGWIIEVGESNPYDASPTWHVYRRETAAEILEKIKADLDEVRNWADQIEDRIEQLKATVNKG